LALVNEVRVIEDAAPVNGTNGALRAVVARSEGRGRKARFSPFLCVSGAPARMKLGTGMQVL
jgi:hypothetical protein